jgi:Protein of unknown function (DUF559)
MRGANDFKTARALVYSDKIRPPSNAPLVSPSLSLHHGSKFVRQKPIEPYIVDFICREKG